MFQITPLPADTFSHLFAKTDSELAADGIVSRIAGEGDNFPCRISLRDAQPGERALLLNFEHHTAASPYRSSYAIFVVEGADEASLAPGELPAVFHGRPLAARAFSADGMLLNVALAMGAEISGKLEDLLEDPEVAYIHVHNAAHGCYSARVDRV